MIQSFTRCVAMAHSVKSLLYVMRRGERGRKGFKRMFDLDIV